MIQQTVKVFGVLFSSVKLWTEKDGSAHQIRIQFFNLHDYPILNENIILRGTSQRIIIIILNRQVES